MSALYDSETTTYLNSDVIGVPTPPPQVSNSRPWLVDFKRYLYNDLLHIPDDQGLVEWWGVSSNIVDQITVPVITELFVVKRHADDYPVWASLARDYLAIMASSVASERAFSSAGITVTKCRNRLKHDIVEALQVLKGALREDNDFKFAGNEEGYSLRDLLDEMDGDDDEDNAEAHEKESVGDMVLTAL